MTTLISRKITLYISLVLMASCISDLDFNYPETEQQVVLNCVLQNDSNIVAKVYWSGKPKDTSFTPITDAKIELWENHQPLDLTPTADNMGNYTFKHTIKSNSQYSIVANVHNKTLKATTITPQKPSLNVASSAGSYVHFTIKVKPLDSSISALYFFVFSEGGRSNYHASPYCNSPFADSFNAALDNHGPTGYNYSYDYFVRVDASYLREDDVTINLAAPGNDKHFLKVLAVNKEYDSYYKSIVIQQSFDPEIDLPFSYYPVPMPSNIMGGLGIFTAIDISAFDF